MGKHRSIEKILKANYERILARLAKIRKKEDRLNSILAKVRAKRLFFEEKQVLSYNRLHSLPAK